MALSSKTAGVVLLLGMLVCVAAQPVEAAELKKETAAAFDRYIGASEARMKSELHNGFFLFIDELPETRRVEAYAQLRTGQVQVKQVTTKEVGRPIEVPHGRIHDWIGLLFIANSSLAQTLAIVQDYDNHQNIYEPEIRHSKLLNRNGDDFKVFLQLYKKSIVTVMINGDFDINYERFGTNRAVSRSYSTRLAEVENAGQGDEHELPVDDAHGYLWRLYSYWRFEERDGGVYVQLESIGLSRAVPAIIGWLVNPLLRSIPRGTITSLLGATRAAVTNLRTKPIPTGLWQTPPVMEDISMRSLREGSAQEPICQDRQVESHLIDPDPIRHRTRPSTVNFGEDVACAEATVPINRIRAAKDPAFQNRSHYSNDVHRMPNAPTRFHSDASAQNRPPAMRKVSYKRHPHDCW